MAGANDAQKRMARASTSYESSRRTGPPLLWPDGGVTGFHPLLDEVLGDNHVVRVRLASGSSSARHSHDCDQVMVVVDGRRSTVDGRGSLVTDDETIELSAGTVVFTPAGVPHRHASDEQSEVEYVYFTRTGDDTLVDPPPSGVGPRPGPGPGA